MLSAVPSLTVSTLMAASPSLTKFGSSFLKAGSSFHRKGRRLPPSLSQLSQSSLHQPPVKQSTDNIGLPPRLPSGHEAELPERPSRACLKFDYIELPPPASKCSSGQSSMVVLYLEHYASCVEYITLLGDSLSSVFPSVHLYFTGINLNAHNLFAITMALAILPSVWLRNLSLLISFW
ncbi:vacuolar amino acid transporter 1-like [Panicum miliaceum]|uniref:Vacuolar amino acid transporter 1-like n=1 Tax=Panicum miliaceum TaxID=4540 RepID=A0A3L6TL18_PANMI|nr:vacuolar amino acid transporter 1-like [Panicum miliaceum]